MTFWAQQNMEILEHQINWLGDILKVEPLKKSLREKFGRLKVRLGQMVTIKNKTLIFFSKKYVY